MRSKWALRLSNPWFETIARRPGMRAIAVRDVVAHPSRFSASSALAFLEAAAGCSIVDDMLGIAKNGGDPFGELGPIDCPVTIATASRDRLFNRPGHFAKFRRLLPDADWVVLDGLGHLPMIDDPEQVAELILARSLA